MQINFKTKEVHPQVSAPLKSKKKFHRKIIKTNFKGAKKIFLFDFNGADTCG
jgi:hypothetical protein